MKNVNKTQLKKSIYMSAREFAELVDNLTDIWITEIDMDGFWFESDGTYGETLTIIEQALSKHFDVHVTSIHTDNSEDDLGVWIVFKEEDEKEEASAFQNPYHIESFINFNTVQILDGVIWGECERHVFQTRTDYHCDNYSVSDKGVFKYNDGDLTLFGFGTEILFDGNFIDDLRSNIRDNFLSDNKDYQISSDEFCYAEYADGKSE